MEATSSDIVGKLVFDADVVHYLKTGSYLIGNATCKEYKHDISVDDPSLDVKHAVIVVSQESTQLMDLFSRHGTYVEGKRVKQFEVVELTKLVKLQFGCVISHYQPCHESDSGFLCLNDSTGKDNSIIPNTPPSRNESLARSINKTGNNSGSSSLLTKSRSSLCTIDDQDNDSFIVKATQVPTEHPLKNNASGVRRSHHSHFEEEDDDFFIPETQEYNHKNISKNLPDADLEINDSCDLFQLNTQDFHEPDDSTNDSDNLIAQITYQDVADVRNDKPAKENCSADKQPHLDVPAKPAANDDSDTDCEEEILNLRLNESVKSGKSIKKSDPADDTRLIPTPDVNISVNDDNLEPTQAFINLNESTKSNQDMPPSPTANNESRRNESFADLEKTQAFVIPVASTSKTHEDDNSNDADALEQTQIFAAPPRHSSHSFSIPCIQKFERARKSAKKAPVEPTEDIAPTQLFRPPDVVDAPIDKADEKSKELNDLEATQRFIAPNAAFVNNLSRSKSPVLLDSDEEDHDSEFCFAETLVIGEESISKKTKNDDSSANKDSKIMNKLFGSDDEEEHILNEQTPPFQKKNDGNGQPDLNVSGVQPTPDFAFFKLPAVKKLDVADAIYRAKVNSVVRSKTLLEESSDEDDENDPVKVMHRLLNESEAFELLPKETKKESSVSKNKKKSPEKKGKEKSAKQNSRKDSSSSAKSVSKKDDKNKDQTSKQTADVNKSSDNKNTVNNKKTEKGKESLKQTDQKQNSATVKNTTEKEKKETRSTNIDIKNEKPVATKRETRQRHEKIKTEKKEDRNAKVKTDKDTKTNDQKYHKTKSETELKKSKKDSKKELEIDENVPRYKLDENKKQKRRHHTSKEDLSVPKKKSKENDPTVIMLDTDEDVIVSLRKSSRSAKPRILFTKMDSKPHEKTVEKIGGTIVESPIDCNVLITDMVYRTWKFLSAMAKGVPIVTTKWLQDSLVYRERNAGALPNFENYLVRDPESEKRFKFTLKKSFDRARQSQIFNGYTFYCTPNTKPVPKELQTIIECGGGKVLKRISKEFVKPEKFYVVSDKRDIAMWMDIRNQIGDVCILSTEAVLIAIMQQSINFKMYLLAS